MTQTLNREEFAVLLETQEAPCLSIYQPTHRRYPENQQDPIRFRNLLKQAEESVRAKYSKAEADAVLEPLSSLLEDREFWNHTTEGLAIFSSPKLFRRFCLSQEPPELVILAKNFHVKPLLRILQSAERFQLLCVNRNSVRLFEGDPHNLEEVELAEAVPRSIPEALGTELTEEHHNVVAIGGMGAGSAVQHGYGGRKDEVQVDDERFFRAVDRAVWEHHSKPSGLPLLLATPAQHHRLFEHVSQNPFLLKEKIAIDAQTMTVEELRKRAWQVLKPQLHARNERMAKVFAEAKAKNMGSDDVREIARAVVESRVRTLAVDADQRIPGQINLSTGRVTMRKDPVGVDDLLDELAEMVLRQKGSVLVLPGSEMPVKTGAAATFRF